MNEYQPACPPAAQANTASPQPRPSGARHRTLPRRGATSARTHLRRAAGPADLRRPTPGPRRRSARPRGASPSGSSTVRARRSERVRRLSCSIALSILGAASAKPPPRPRPPRSPAPYIPTLAGPAGGGASSPRPELRSARVVLRRVGPRHRRQPASQPDPPPPPLARSPAPFLPRPRFPPGLARPSGNCSSGLAGPTAGRSPASTASETR